MACLISKGDPASKPPLVHCQLKPGSAILFSNRVPCFPIFLIFPVRLFLTFLVQHIARRHPESSAHKGAGADGVVQ